MNEQIDREADVREWLAHARADRQAANALFEAGLYSACAFHCQQAVEKLLKAAIVADLSLLGEIRERGIVVYDAARDTELELA